MPSPEATSRDDDAVGRAFIQSTQERFYTRLAIARGWEPNPLEAYARYTALGAPSSISTEPLKVALRHEGIQAADWAKFDDAVKQGFAQYKNVRLPTPYEDPVFYPIVSTMFDRVYTALEEKGRGVAHRPIIATLPSGQPNALGWPVPDTPLLAIFFEQGLFRYFHHFALATGWAMPALPFAALGNDAALLNLPSRHEMPGEASSIFGAVLVSYGVNGTPPPGSGGVPSPEHNLTAVPALLNYMEEFVLVHELAHLVNRDAERLETKTVSPWDAEYQADQWAASVVTALAYRSTGAFALAFIACDLALTAQHFLDLTLSTLQYGAKPFSWISPTHPDALSRRKRLRLSMGDMLPPDAPASAPAAQTLVRMTDALLMQLWQLAAPEVILAFQSGQRPASVWRDHVRASIQVTGDRPIQ